MITHLSWSLRYSIIATAMAVEHKTEMTPVSISVVVGRFPVVVPVAADADFKAWAPNNTMSVELSVSDTNMTCN